MLWLRPIRTASPNVNRRNGPTPMYRRWLSSGFPDKAGERDFSQIAEILPDLRKWIGDADTRLNGGRYTIAQIGVGNAGMFDQCADDSVGCEFLSALRKGRFLASLYFELRMALCLSAPRPNSVFFFPIAGRAAPQIEYFPGVLWITTLGRIRIRTTKVQKQLTHGGIREVSLGGGWWSKWLKCSLRFLCRLDDGCMYRIHHSSFRLLQSVDLVLQIIILSEVAVFNQRRCRPILSDVCIGQPDWIGNIKWELRRKTARKFPFNVQ
ncbi:hypothetical protein [Agrobacterium tumefaciens]|uniref:hypothetical protein n=1 Tax=Agrobacterium tumefaciens TaxID=358 RepID=UPI003BA3B551